MFICFEGIAGGGKTTQTKLLADYLKNVKKKEIFISAVYEGERRKAISDFMNASGIKFDQNAVMFLFQALHAAQYHEVNKAISINKIVIADRWRYSFFAHHLCQDTFGKNKNLMCQLDLFAYRSLEPDIYFLIDIPAKIAYSRYIERERSINDNGLDPEKYSGLALGMGLDRLVMIIKGIDDIRVLRSNDPRIRRQMTNLKKFVNVSDQPATKRVLSYSTSFDKTKEDICEEIRDELEQDAVFIEKIEYSEVSYNQLPEKARLNLGIRPDQKNVVVTPTFRSLENSLPKAMVNEWIKNLYPKLNQGDRGYM